MASRLFTRQEVEARSSKEDAAIIIDNVVYDVSAFLDDHPGGPEVLLDNAGRDASKCFADVGHSEDAVEWRRRYAVGEVVPEERREVVRASPLGTSSHPLTLANVLVAVWPPALLAITSYFLYSYLF